MESNNGDDDIEIEGESSAWDVLQQQFRDAVAERRFVDLTEDTAIEAPTLQQASCQSNGRQVPANRPSSVTVKQESRNDANNSEPSARRAPARRATTVAVKQESRNDDSADNAPRSLTRLWSLLSNVIDSLENARNEIHGAVAGQSDERPRRRRARQVATYRRLLSIVQQINQQMLAIQLFCNYYPDEVANSSRAIERVQKMNQLVMKANIIIAHFNSTINNNPHQSQANPAANQNRRPRRPRAAASQTRRHPKREP